MVYFLKMFNGNKLFHPNRNIGLSDFYISKKSISDLWCHEIRTTYSICNF